MPHVHTAHLSCRLAPLRGHRYRILHQQLAPNRSLAWQALLASSSQPPHAGRRTERAELAPLGSSSVRWVVEVEARPTSADVTLGVLLGVGIFSSLLIAALVLLLLLER